MGTAAVLTWPQGGASGDEAFGTCSGEEKKNNKTTNDGGFFDDDPVRPSPPVSSDNHTIIR